MSLRMKFLNTGEKSAFRKIFMPSKFVQAKNRLSFDSPDVFLSFQMTKQHHQKIFYSLQSYVCGKLIYDATF